LIWIVQVTGLNFKGHRFQIVHFISMTKETFIKYLEGNCTDVEFEQFLLWIKEESQKDSAKDFVRDFWEGYEPEARPVERIKYTRLLDKIHHQININRTSNQLEVPQKSTTKRLITILTRAAAILLLPVLALLFYTNLSDKKTIADNLNDLEVEAPAGSQLHFNLGDGTEVWLNHGSKLKYPFRFNRKTREVFLTGEAFFKVAHDTEVPFIVETKSLEVKATGTSFNVSAYPTDDNVQTTLIEGKVVVSEKESKHEVKAMLPGEFLKFDLQKKVYETESGNTEKYTSWKDGRLVFKNEKVSDVAKKLARWYNVEVEIVNEKVNEFTFTATFMEETLPQVLDLLTLATPVDYKLTLRVRLPDGSYTKQKVLIGLKPQPKNNR